MVEGSPRELIEAKRTLVSERDLIMMRPIKMIAATLDEMYPADVRRRLVDLWKEVLDIDRALIAQGISDVNCLRYKGY